MTFKDLRLAFAKIINTQYSQQEKQSFFNLLVAHHIGYTRFEAHENDNSDFPKEKKQVFLEAIQRLETNEPIQYIIGDTEFFGLKFKVNRYTLIPRPETEELVAWVIGETKNKNKKIKVLDIGTGSGCIAISLAKNMVHAQVSGFDISEGALETARLNASINKVKVDFKFNDILAADKLLNTYDIIVSNPPYVRDSEKSSMNFNVLDYEPPSALFVSDKNPLVFYKKIALLAKEYLKPDGTLFFEINEYLGLQIIKMLEDLSFSNIVLKNDIFGKARMIKCNLKQ